jgi:hypothetical protein
VSVLDMPSSLTCSSASSKPSGLQLACGRCAREMEMIRPAVLIGSLVFGQHLVCFSAGPALQLAGAATAISSAIALGRSSSLGPPDRRIGGAKQHGLSARKGRPGTRKQREPRPDAAVCQPPYDRHGSYTGTAARACELFKGNADGKGGHYDRQ